LVKNREGGEENVFKRIQIEKEKMEEKKKVKMEQIRMDLDQEYIFKPNTSKSA
jgi:hypothetical protein